MTLNYLDFDYSEDADGTGTFDAMASVAPAQAPALQAEIIAVLAWAHGHWPNSCGPLDEGGAWHYDLQGLQEVSTPLMLEFDTAARDLRMSPGTAALPRTTLTFTVTGGQAFCGAFRDWFGVD